MLVDPRYISATQSPEISPKACAGEDWGVAWDHASCLSFGAGTLQFLHTWPDPRACAILRAYESYFH